MSDFVVCSACGRQVALTATGVMRAHYIYLGTRAAPWSDKPLRPGLCRLSGKPTEDVTEEL